MNETKTRAAIAPPRSKSFLPDAATTAPARTADNMKGERLAPMTFNMPRDWHTRFKITAATLGVDMKQLLIMSFEAFEREQRGRIK